VNEATSRCEKSRKQPWPVRRASMTAVMTMPVANSDTIWSG